ncbi:MAG: ABC transporter permease, partial [Sciscionella sp.]
MTGFLVRRLANYVLLCLVATFLAYCLASATFHPLDSLKQRNPPPSAQTLASKAHELHLNQPIPRRFVAWASGVLRGDFGQTVQGVPITDELWSRVGV